MPALRAACHPLPLIPLLFSLAGWAADAPPTPASTPATTAAVRVADPPGAHLDTGFFGIGSSSLRSRDLEKWLPQMTAIGIRDLRSTGTGWGGAEPTAGGWTFDTLDQRLAYIESQGVATGGIIIGIPAWLKQKYPKGGFPLADIAGWSAYVGQVVAHTKGRITRFEVWNEPPNGTGNAPASDYAKLLVAAYDAAKAANPACKVGMAAKSVHVNYLDQAIRAGAKGHYDYITLHPYETLGCITAHPGTEPVYLAIAPTVRRMLKALDPAKADVPIRFTEIGFDSKHGADKQAHALVKAYTLGLAQGIECIEWFEGMDGDSGPLGLLDRNAKPRPAYTAMAQLIARLGQQAKPLGWVLLGGVHYGFIFQGVKGPLLATWSATSAGGAVDFGAEVTLIDPLTATETRARNATLTLAPLLVEGVPAALVAEAKANAGKPIPWGGDFSTAKAVSVTYGERNVEQGLHTMSGDSIAADVVTYGGNARAGTVPGGNVFMVDPNFLSYATVPLEITAVVRRGPDNKPAKLELDYESTTGSRKADPFEIPDKQEWSTATWRIDDAQFVGMYAFNFRFNKGSYSVQKVTVTRLDR